MARTYNYISADAHFESPPETWAHRIPPQYRDRAPHRIKLPNGGDAIVSEGRPINSGGTGLYGGIGPEKFDPTRYDFDATPGCGTPQQRLQEQDQDGVDAEVLFALGVRQTSIKSRDAFHAIIRAYNDYLAEEYCAVDPDRLIGVGVLPSVGAEGDVAEMTHCAELGLKAVCLTAYPSGKNYPTEEDDRFWAAVVDLDMPVTIHTSLMAKVGDREVALYKYPLDPQGEAKPPTDYVQRLARQAPYHSGSVEASQLVVSGLFDRFPTLRIYWAENNIGWIPYYYEQMDHEYEVNRFWVQRSLGLPLLKNRPSEYLREAAYWGFFEDAFGMRVRDEIGVDRILWSTDFPHLVTRWPHSLETWEKQAAGVPEADRRKMVADNAIGFFHLDHVPA
ncbi:MAG: amidohydrolase [Chloroflexi bacterium]|nr:amidohydrolase [Chloroflexota bacterium]MCH7655150.1 amidohydrolase [Chloroflexota bacterium]